MLNHYFTEAFILYHDIHFQFSKGKDSSPELRSKNLWEVTLPDKRFKDSYVCTIFILDSESWTHKESNWNWLQASGKKCQSKMEHMTRQNRICMI